MKKFLVILLGLLLLSFSSAWALNPSAGTITSWSDTQVGSRGVRLLQISYVTGSGTFTVTSDREMTGWILHIETDPGTTTPTDNYDITVKNDNGRDIAGGGLSNRDQTNTEYLVIEDFNWGKLTIAVTAAGTSKTAEILIYYLP